MKSLSCVRLFATPWTVACQAPPFMGFSRQNTGVGCHFLLQGNLPDSGVEPGSSTLQADSLPSEPRGSFKSCGLMRMVVVIKGEDSRKSEREGAEEGAQASPLPLPPAGCQSLLDRPGWLRGHVWRPFPLPLLPPRGDHGPPRSVRPAAESASGEHH